jgi:hypothetical protein
MSNFIKLRRTFSEILFSTAALQLFPLLITNLPGLFELLHLPHFPLLEHLRFLLVPINEAFYFSYNTFLSFTIMV